MPTTKLPSLNYFGVNELASLSDSIAPHVYELDSSLKRAEISRKIVSGYLGNKNSPEFLVHSTLYAACKEEPIVRVKSHGDFSIGLRLYMWVSDINDLWYARFRLLEHIKKRFDREGIEIPFPYRTMVYKKDLPPPRKFNFKG